VSTAGITVRVTSEIDPLDHVLVHRPGDEVVRMTQHAEEPRAQR
jgi:arginine deiminase